MQQFTPLAPGTLGEANFYAAIPLFWRQHISDDACFTARLFALEDFFYR
jgi:hypothetical protein